MIWVTLRNTQGATLALSWLVLSIPPPLLGAAVGAPVLGLYLAVAAAAAGTVLWLLHRRTT